MWFLDRLANFVTGLGTGKDKGTGGVHVVVPRTKDQLDAAYRDNWIARKAIDIVPFDMLREGRQWQGDEKQVEALERAEQDLGVFAKVKAAMVRGRLYGGGCILVGDGTLDPSQELRIDAIGAGGIKYLHVLSMHEIVAGEIDRDPMSPFFGEPRDYEIRSGSGQGRKIHPSRVIRFLGAPLPDDATQRTESVWSDSILQAILDSIDQATSASAYIAAMLPEAKQDIISVPGLSTHLQTAESTRQLTERFAYASMMKGMHGMLLLEGDGTSPTGELYQQKQLSFAHLTDVAKLFLEIASGAADIPVTRMLGQAPKGMNATGESDLRNYYDHVAAKQKVELTPALRRLDRMLIRHALGAEPDGLWYEWRPLYQPSEKEKAEVGKIKAETVGKLADSGVIPADVLAEGTKGWLINSDLLPGIEDAYEAHGDDLTGQDEDDLDETGQPRSNVVPLRRQAAADAAPRTLYVSRKLKNADDVLAWAKSQGFASLMPAGELHVTVAYSRTPLDWMKAGQDWRGAELKIEAGGPRLIEAFGDAIVLLFASDDLKWRWSQLREAGASWDHEDYQPHVTFTYERGDVDLAKVQPYNGPLIFGPEIFTEVDDGWKAKATAAE